MSYIVQKLRTEKKKEEEEKLKGVVRGNPFNEEEFDGRVAKSIAKTHNDITYNEKNRKYKKWCVKNLEELRHMFELSTVESTFNEFCSSVFQSN